MAQFTSIFSTLAKRTFNRKPKRELKDGEEIEEREKKIVKKLRFILFVCTCSCSTRS